MYSCLYRMAQNPMDVHLVKIETNHSMPFRFCCNPICQMEIQKRIIYTITSCLPEIYIEWHQLYFAGRGGGGGAPAARFSTGIFPEVCERIFPNPVQRAGHLPDGPHCISRTKACQSIQCLSSRKRWFPHDFPACSATLP